MARAPSNEIPSTLPSKDFDCCVTHRRKGNELYKMSDLSGALLLYNMSVLTGEWLTGRVGPCRPGPELALAFGNRSAVLVEMEQFHLALRDLKEASLCSDLPTNTKKKLFLRRCWCMTNIGASQSEMKECNQEMEEFCKVLNPSERNVFVQQVAKKQRASDVPLKASVTNDQLSAVDSDGHTCRLPIAVDSSKYRVSCLPDRGRFLTATACIQQGNVIMTDTPFALVLNQELSDYRCNFCAQQTRAPYPCYFCTAVQYCSSACLERAWKSGHWFSCTKRLQLTEMVLLGLHLLLASKPAQVKDHLSAELAGRSSMPGIADLSSWYPSVCSLVDNEAVTPPAVVEELKGTISCLLKSHGRALLTHVNKEDEQSTGDQLGKSSGEGDSTFRDHWLKADESVEVPDDAKVESRPSASDSNRKCISGISEQELGDVLLRCCLQVKYNTHAATALVESGRGGREGVASVAHTRIASAVYPKASLINHSCDPNAIVRFDNTLLSVVATRSISQGEEISICYGPHCLRMRKEDRRRVLLEKYAFLCKCTACDSSDREVQVADALKCPKCCEAIAFKAKVGAQSAICTSCGHLLSVSGINSILKQFALATSLYNDAMIKMADRNSPHECRIGLLECLAIRQTILFKWNKCLGETHDSLAQLFALQGDYVRATKHCQLSVAVVEALFGDRSIELAHELHKLAQLLFNSKQVEEAKVTIERALRLFSLCDGKQEEPAQELEAMMKCLLSLA